ncbi:hypothetical protein KY314_05220 [Candidatus Woesearchaeota archaeon]|nr:hypothetical protein [Candidatus Woesearchaeota archaeon]
MTNKIKDFLWGLICRDVGGNWELTTHCYFTKKEALSVSKRLKDDGVWYETVVFKLIPNLTWDMGTPKANKKGDEGK